MNTQEVTMYSPAPEHVDVLTYDERKAAEAAFQGQPLNPCWTQRAQGVYWGIVEALATRQ